jgi:hypothetical protein
MAVCARDDLLGGTPCGKADDRDVVRVLLVLDHCASEALCMHPVQQRDGAAMKRG